MYLIYKTILFPWFVIGIVSFLTLLRIKAPYGKFSSTSWGKLVPFKLGWILQEIISPIIFSYFFLFGEIDHKSIAWVFFILWNFHYINRSIIIPIQQKRISPPMPVIIVLAAISFNLINGFINGYWLGTLKIYNTDYLMDIRFISGIMIFICGSIINIKSDRILLKLKNKNKGYKIPNGFLYNYISCPNYFGEIIEWIGFAIMTWSIPGFLFVAWTAFNLTPRALSNHNWYKNKFADYPKNRKAIIPFIL